MSCNSGSDQEKTMVTQINQIGSAGTCRRGGRALPVRATAANAQLPTNVPRWSSTVCGLVTVRSAMAAFVKMGREQTEAVATPAPPVRQFDPSRLNMTR